MPQYSSVFSERGLSGLVISLAGYFLDPDLERPRMPHCSEMTVERNSERAGWARSYPASTRLRPDRLRYVGMICIVEGTHSSTSTSPASDTFAVPNWFSSHTAAGWVLLGTSKQSSCVAGLIVG